MECSNSMWTTAGCRLYPCVCPTRMQHFCRQTSFAISCLAHKFCTLFVASFSFTNLKQSHVSTATETTATLSFASLFSILIFLCAWTRVTSSVIYTYFASLLFLSGKCYSQSASTMRRRWRKSRLNNINSTMKCIARSRQKRGFGSADTKRRRKKQSQKRKWEKLEHATRVH